MYNIYFKKWYCWQTNFNDNILDFSKDVLNNGNSELVLPFYLVSMLPEDNRWKERSLNPWRGMNGHDASTSSATDDQQNSHLTVLYNLRLKGLNSQEKWLQKWNTK